jgi:polyisoprenoid-binding protein YceI
MFSFKPRSFSQSFLLPTAVCLFALTVAWVLLNESSSTRWQVNASSSSLTFNTTKSGSAGVGGITEIMRFTRYEGDLNKLGHIELKIDLTSIDSGIPIRDERLQTMLWNVGQYPSVTFSAKISPETMRNLTKEPMVLEVHGLLTMAGQSQPVKTQLQVTPVNGKVLVSTLRPILVKADDFGLSSGVEALRAIMGLNYLSSTVPVNFQLELGKKSIF